jgi:hypothetical protein
MSETKFTPGKWTWWTSNSWRRLRSEDGSITREVLTPHTSRSDGHPDIIVSEEDMALIAAAPDLYAALANMLAHAERSNWIAKPDDEDVAGAARAALQRARGETP